MKESEIRQLLESVSSKRLTVSDAIARLKHLPFEDIDFAKVDHHRALRQGYAEVVFGKGKTPAQVAEIVRVMLRHKGSRHNILVTRADAKTYAAVKRVKRDAEFHPLSGLITIERSNANHRKGNHPDRFGGHQRYSCGGRSVVDGSKYGQPCRAPV